MFLRRTIDVAPPGAIMVPCLTVIVALWGTMWLAHDVYFSLPVFNTFLKRFLLPFLPLGSFLRFHPN